MHLITMKTIGNLKPSLVMMFLLLTQLLSFTAVAEEKNITVLDKQWDKDFFLFNCPGSTLQETPVLENHAKTDIVADEYSRTANGSVVFKGNVNLQQGFSNLSADRAELSEIKNSFSATGNVHYQDQQLRLITDAIELNFKQLSGVVKQSKFQLIKSTIRGEAEAISLHTEKPLEIKNVGFTSCPPGKESWLLQSSNVEIDPKTGWGEADDVILRLNEIPVFYLPSISFPVDERRKSGFLYPSIGTSVRNGLEMELPWYWNIASNKDATFTPRPMSKRGVMLGAEYRQLTEQTETIIFAEYLPNDAQGLPGNEERFFYRLDSDYSSGEHWSGNLAVSSVSDDDYFFDFGGNFSSGNVNLLQRIAQIHFDDQYMSFGAIVSDDKLLSSAEKSYSRLPQLRLSLLYPERVMGIASKILMEATAFRRENSVEAERLMIIPEFSLPMEWLSGYIKPQLKVNYSYYSQNDPTDNLPDTVSRSIPIFSVDSGLFFERMVEFNQQSYAQTFEPRLYYLYVPNKEQSEIGLFDTTSINNGVDSLFRENRYSGFDRIGDSNQLSLAITSRFFEQASGQERLSLTVGRAYYLENREVNLALYSNGQPAVDLGIDKRVNSALITNLQLSLYDHWWLKGELEYDDSQSRTEKGVLDLQYSSPALLLNLRHRSHRFDGSEDIEQAEVSLAWPVTKELSFVGRWQQDIINNRTIDGFAGLEYESCCWAVRLVARRYLNIRLDQQGIPVPGNEEFNNGIYLEFILKGLTNIGDGLNLESDIQGYEDRFSN